MWKKSGGRNIAKWKEIDGQIGNLMGAKKKITMGRANFLEIDFFRTHDPGIPINYISCFINPIWEDHRIYFMKK